LIFTKRDTLKLGPNGAKNWTPSKAEQLVHAYISMRKCSQATKLEIKRRCESWKIAKDTREGKTPYRTSINGNFLN
jgi:hypothetical protein